MRMLRGAENEGEGMMRELVGLVFSRGQEDEA